MSRLVTTPTSAEIAAARARVPRAFAPPRRGRIAFALLCVSLFAFGLWRFDVTPARLVEGFSRLAGVASFMFPPELWTTWASWAEALHAMAQTLAMAFLGTLFGAIAAFPLALLGARNVTPARWLRWPARRGFDALRAVEQVVLALIFIRAFGLGPLAGVMAIAVMETGYLAKLFAEAIETAAPGPVDGVRASGGSSLQTVRIAILPDVAPILISTTLYELESNARSSTILGVVGAGGIGGLIIDRIGANDWPEVWTLILLVITAVSALDALSAMLRRSLIGPATPR